MTFVEMVRTIFKAPRAWGYLEAQTRCTGGALLYFHASAPSGGDIFVHFLVGQGVLVSGG